MKTEAVADNKHVRVVEAPGFWLVALVVVLIVFQSLLFGLWYYRSVSGRQDAKVRQEQTLCLFHIQGAALGYAFDALAAPPVPVDISPEEFAKTERGIAVTEGLKQVDRLKDSKTCTQGEEAARVAGDSAFVHRVTDTLNEARG